MITTTKKEDLEAVASLFGRAKAIPGPLSVQDERNMGASLDAHVRLVMRTTKERLSSLREGSLQVQRTLKQSSVRSVGRGFGRLFATFLRWTLRTVTRGDFFHVVLLLSDSHMNP